MAPRLARGRSLIREIVPYADRRSSQLQEAVDDLVQQDRLLPGQLPRLLRLMGVGQVLVPADGRPERSGALEPRAPSAPSPRSHGWRSPAQSYGARLRATPAHGWGGEA